MNGNEFGRTRDGGEAVGAGKGRGGKWKDSRREAGAGKGQENVGEGIKGEGGGKMGGIEG